MKSGFVMLAGRSNVGKSTLLNALVGSKIAIVTPKPQTTRHPIRGILHDTRGQLVFIDTPGVFLGRKDSISRRLNEHVKESLVGVDAIVYVLDPTRSSGPEEEYIQRLLRASRVPIIVVINKTDAPLKERFAMDIVKRVDVGQTSTIEISALKRQNLNRLVDALFAVAPEGPPHYPELQLTDLGHNQWLEELIREKVFMHLDKEIPYTVQVTIEETETRKDGTRYIKAGIQTTDERYKRMIVGAKASMLKAIGSDARKEIEAATGSKIYLDLTVEVDAKWQERFR